MIEFISGKIFKKIPGEIVVNVNGIGYRLYISLNTYNQLPKLDQDVLLDTYYSVSENSHDLYGFSDILEKDLFIMLISVSGIGPKTAISLLSAVKPDDFKNRLIAGEVKMLTDLPGIGPKTAKRIIIELKDKLSDYSSDSISSLDDDGVINDALNALNVLGYSGIIVRRKIDEILTKNPNIETAELIKETLNKIK